MRILFVDIDTLRPDHMGCYGYHRNTTPNLDKIAEEGVRFDRFYCSDAPCLPSRAALISGQFGIHNGAVGHGGTAGDRRLIGRERGFRDRVDAHNFNRIFRQAGMHTASISSFAERHSSYWYTANFHETYNVGKCGNESGEEVLPIALDWIDRNAEKDDWYLHLHLWDPHTPYRTPADFENPFADEPLNTFITPEIFARHKKASSPHGLNEMNMYDDETYPQFPKHPGRIDTYEDLRLLFDGYDCGIYYADWVMGQVFDALKKKGVYEDMAIIVTADHGENFGEIGVYSEHGTADEATCRIPMLIRWPGGPKGAVDTDFHYLLDLVPTMADLLGTPKWDKWDGLSFAPVITEGERAGRDYVVISQMAHVCQRGVRFGDWLYIRTIHDGFRLYDREMLFNLKDDPHEQYDLKEEHPDICAKAARMLLEWQEEMMLTSESPVDPMWTVMFEGGPYHTVGEKDGYVRRLMETGREEAGRALAERDYHTH